MIDSGFLVIIVTSVLMHKFCAKDKFMHKTVLKCYKNSNPEKISVFKTKLNFELQNHKTNYNSLQLYFCLPNFPQNLSPNC